LELQELQNPTQSHILEDIIKNWWVHFNRKNILKQIGLNVVKMLNIIMYRGSLDTVILTL
jgi:hypothetical protein